MRRSYTIEGVVIKRSNFGESDKLITLYTKHVGKIKVIAKGIRRIHSRKAPHLELFNLIRAHLVTGRNFDIITEVQPLKVYKNLSTSLKNIAFAYKVVEEIDSLCPEGEQSQNVYKLLLVVLGELNTSSNDPQKIIEKFTLSLLWDLGFLPKNKIIKGAELENFLREILERNLKSEVLLTRMGGKL